MLEVRDNVAILAKGQTQQCEVSTLTSGGSLVCSLGREREREAKGERQKERGKRREAEVRIKGKVRKKQKTNQLSLGDVFICSFVCLQVPEIRSWSTSDSELLSQMFGAVHFV